MYGQMPYMIPNAFLSNAPNAGALASNTANASSGLGALLKKINLSSILSNAQKTLNVVNQAIPLYYQVKPVFKNLKTLGKIGKEFTKINTPTSNNVNNQNEAESKATIETNETNIKDDYPNPTFFL